MSNDIRELFRSLSSNLENSSTVEKVVAVECQNVLDNVVRPTIKIVHEEIKSSRVIVKEEILSILVVHEDGNGYDELVFECNDRVLQTIARVEGKQDSITYSLNLDAVSQASVANAVKTFLEERLKPSRGR